MVDILSLSLSVLMVLNMFSLIRRMIDEKKSRVCIGGLLTNPNGKTFSSFTEPTTQRGSNM